MVSFMKKLLLTLALVVCISSLAISQTRIVVLPFANMDGNIKLNIYSYKLQDSLFKALQQFDPDGKNFQLVPLDSVEIILADLNLDPNNPQYQTDMWKAVKLLKVQKVVSGNFNLQAERFLINGYIIDVETKLYDKANQARDIFKKEERILEAVPTIIKRISPALIKS
jgi:TolB-like protein